MSDAENEAEYCLTWLSLQCARIPGVATGLLALRQSDGEKLSVAAVWPDRNAGLPNLARLVELAYSERRIAVSRSQPSAGAGPTHAGNLLIAVPLGVGEVIGVVAVSLKKQHGTEQPAPESIAEQLRWGAGWLAALPFVRGATANTDGLALATSCTDLLVVCGEQHHLQGLVITIVNDLAARLQCDRVSLGTLKRSGAIRLRAISHSARFKNEGRLIDAIENAMEEAVDQLRAVAYPPIAATERAVTMGHQSLADVIRGRDSQLLTVVVSDGRSRPVGAITFERHRKEPFDTRTYQLAQTFAALIGPVLAQQLRANRLFAGRIVDLAGDGIASILGRGRPSLKLAAIAVVVLAAYLPFASGQHRVTAKAVLEPELQRAAVAPFDGYIRSAAVRAGDTVSQGQELAKLEDRDLVLDRLNRRAERDKLLQKQRDALAKHERTNVVILNSQVQQAESSLALSEAMLSRSRIVAPFDGIVVSGDLSQSLGSPVSKGDTLFEIAPLNSYRLIINVDERDVRYISVGEHGKVSLAGAPGQPLPLVVSKIVPVAVAEDGHNSLKVEARLLKVTPTLQPGMEGVAKIETGERNLFWIWSHRLIDAIRLTVWKYLP